MSKTKKLLSIIVLVSMVISTNLTNVVQAASITNAFDRISDSKPSEANVTHNITFTPHATLDPSDYYEITLATEFGDIPADTNITCTPTAGSLTRSLFSAEKARCTAASGFSPATTTVTITGVNNPAAEGSYLVTIKAYDSSAGFAVLEQVTMVVAIVNNVVMSANVPSSLIFSISGLGTSTPINSATTTGSSTANTINFGALVASTTYSSVMGQQLSVTTNASYGYKVTVEQDQNMVSLSGATIDSFQNNAAPASPIAWTAPTGTLDATTTYGHMGFTTDDATLSSTTPSLYVGNKWMGFTGAGTQEVMYHTGPADGSTQDKGSVKIAYRIQISALQEAGDYTNTLTYVATPTY